MGFRRIWRKEERKRSPLSFCALIDQVAAASYDRQAVADHANNLATKIRGNLTNSMKAIGVDILTGVGSVVVCRFVTGNVGGDDESRFCFC